MKCKQCRNHERSQMRKYAKYTHGLPQIDEKFKEYKRKSHRVRTEN